MVEVKTWYWVVNLIKSIRLLKMDMYLAGGIVMRRVLKNMILIVLSLIMSQFIQNGLRCIQ